MSGLEFLPGGGPAMVLVAAILLGLRHSTDPDHLTAVATLLLSEPVGRSGGPRRAGWLGLAWGVGHATTLALVGLPLVLAGGSLPEGVHRGAEIAVGLLITFLALRLLVRWRCGYFHMHPHRHGGVQHVHPHFHEHATTEGHPALHEHDHAHREHFGRTPLGAFGVGLIHGVGGSAGAGVLVAAALPDAAGRALALALFAAATALSMAAVSFAVGCLTCRPGAARTLETLIPVLGAACFLFGLWYSLQAAELNAFGPW